MNETGKPALGGSGRFFKVLGRVAGGQNSGACFFVEEEEIARHVNFSSAQGRGHNAVAFTHLVAMLGMRGVSGRQRVAIDFNRVGMVLAACCMFSIVAGGGMAVVMTLRLCGRAGQFGRAIADVGGTENNQYCQSQRDSNIHNGFEQSVRIPRLRWSYYPQVLPHSTNILFPVTRRSSANVLGGGDAQFAPTAILELLSV